MTEVHPPPQQGDRLPIGGTAIQARLADAAIELFYARGAPATTVREITAACGLTPGALYNHFTSKDHLLFLLVRDIHLQVNDQLAELAAATGPDPARQLEAMTRFLVSHTAGYKKRSRVANREFTVLTGTRREEVRLQRRRLRDQFTAVLVAGGQQGVFDLVGGNDVGSATLVATTITSLCVHISEWTLENYPLGMADLQDRFARMVLRIPGTAPARA